MIQSSSIKAKDKVGGRIVHKRAGCVFVLFSSSIFLEFHVLLSENIIFTQFIVKLYKIFTTTVFGDILMHSSHGRRFV